MKPQDNTEKEVPQVMLSQDHLRDDLILNGYRSDGDIDGATSGVLSADLGMTGSKSFGTFEVMTRGDDYLETRSESALPIRPPRPSKLEMKLADKDSLNQSELRSNDRKAQCVRTIRNARADNTLQRQDTLTPRAADLDPFDENKLDLHPVSNNDGTADLPDDKSLISSSGSIGFDDFTTATSTPDDRSSTVSICSTVTAGELDIEADSLSLSDTDNEVGAPANRQSMASVGGDSAYLKVYDAGKEREADADIEAETMPFSRSVHVNNTMNPAEELGDGLERETKDDGNKISESLALKQESDDTTVNITVPTTTRVQHLHIHINLNFSEKLLKTATTQACVTTNKEQDCFDPDKIMTKEGVSDPTLTEERNEHNDSAAKTVTDAYSKTSKPKVPPTPAKRKVKVGREVTRSSTLPAKLAEPYIKSKGNTKWQFSLGNLLKPFNKIYDEIELTDGKDGKDQEIDKQNTTDTSEQQCYCNSQSELCKEEEKGSQPSWLVEYSSDKQPEKMINKDIDGSFVIIEEDRVSMPFTPFTLLVAKDRHLMRIPVTKHRLLPILKHRLMPHGSFMAKDSYSLPMSPNNKMRSVKDIVAYYTKHEIRGIKLKLVLPKQEKIERSKDSE